MALYNLQRIGTAMIPSTAMPPSTAFPTTAAGVIPQSFQHIQEGKYTQTIYSLIRDGKYKEVIRLLTSSFDTGSRNRAGLSLLAYSYYMLEDYENAIHCYETLVKHNPEGDEYRLYYAQSLYKLGQLQSAYKVSCSINSEELLPKVSRLQAAIKFELNDLSACKVILDAVPQHADKIIDMASISFKEGKIDEALEKYTEALTRFVYDAEVCYYIALCFYLKKEYSDALKYLSDIVEHGMKEFPELNVGLVTEGVDVRSVGNSQLLHDSFLVEAFNLKAAIEFITKNSEAAIEAIHDMPPRDDEELDSVTLHNQALILMEKEPTSGLEKLNFLLTTPDCPPETLRNLLLFYLKFSYYDVAADLLATNRSIAEVTMNSSTLRFVDALIMKQTSPEDAFNHLDDISNEYIEDLRKITKCVQEARAEHNEVLLRTSIKEYDATIEAYIPVLMAQATIYWDKQNYDVVEKIFRRSIEFCNDRDAWKLNVAHTLFMQEDKYKEAITFYEPFIEKNYDNILDVSAIVLANICVSYIMTSQNEQAEDLMKHVEEEEERMSVETPSKRYYHFCIINLVLGTLYCAKGNHEFGITRVMKSMEPMNKKLGMDTWFYAKRCLMALLESLAKQMLILKDAIMTDIINFLDECEAHGKDIQVTSDPALISAMDLATNSVRYEARLLKSHFLRL